MGTPLDRKTKQIMNWIKKFKRLPYLINFLYEKATTSIAFYPTLIAVFFLLLTSLMLFLEGKGLTTWIEKNIPVFLVIKSWEIAQSILTTLVGALISLMVFSFSMVMVLLNNAASNYSPRILPSLIANKFHQFVLGTYLGTITYCLLLAINMTPTRTDAVVPSMSILLGIFFGLTCLMIFVFFIHSISEAVQVGKILESLAATTRKKLENGAIATFVNQPVPDISSWKTYKTDRVGYLKYVNCEKISKLCAKHQLKIKVLIPTRTYVVDEVDLFCCNQKLEDDLKNKILEGFIFSENEVAEDDHVIGIKQITEIAVKAMSPGINDPGTALSALNYLTILFSKKMDLKDASAFPLPSEGEASPVVFLWLKMITFQDLLFQVLAALRAYARQDLMVMLQMLRMLNFLVGKENATPDFRKVIRLEAEKIRIDAEQYLTNPEDYKEVETFVAKIKKEPV